MPWTLSRRALSVLLALFLVTDSFAAPAAPLPAPVPLREPLIEVSVDTLEITENNTNTLGLLWGQIGLNPSNRLNFFEQTVPSLFEVGSFSRERLAGQIDAMIRNQQIRVLANPTLLTKSGFEANFLVGGEIPYPTVGQGGVGGVEYKKYGVGLKILPTLSQIQTIIAQINVNVSNPDNSVSIKIEGTDVPGLASREASTKVEVKDGETVVMAGIKESRRQKIITRIPFLGRIPILGLLFTHKDEQTIQTSLVIFVTFRLVKS